MLGSFEHQLSRRKSFRLFNFNHQYDYAHLRFLTLAGAAKIVGIYSAPLCP